MKAKIEVVLKDGVFDPQGKVLVNALHHLEYKDVLSVRAGKLFYIELDGNDASKAQARLAEMADQLFANPVIENFKIEIVK